MMACVDDLDMRLESAAEVAQPLLRRFPSWNRPSRPMAHQDALLHRVGRTTFLPSPSTRFFDYLRLPQPGVLPANRDILEVSTVLNVGTVVVAEFQRLV